MWWAFRTRAGFPFLPTQGQCLPIAKRFFHERMDIPGVTVVPGPQALAILVPQKERATGSREISCVLLEANITD